METALHNILERVRAAAADATPLRLCGGGSKDFHGLALEGTPLELRPLRGIISYEPTELVVTARAGTPLQELEAALADAGQTLAFEPPHFAQGDNLATVGGMVAAGWSGPSGTSRGRRSGSGRAACTRTTRAPSTSTAAIPRYSKKAGTSLPSISPRAATARS